MRDLAFVVSILAASALAVAAEPSVAQDVTVTVAESADRTTRTLTHETTVPAGVGQVWNAVATAEGWRTWAVPLAREIPGADRFETSYNPAASPGGPDTIEHEWLSREAPKHATFRTTRTPAGFPHAEAYMRVVSAFVLTPLGPDATHVRLVSEGYGADEAGDALIDFFGEGNRMTLEQLKARFVSGPVDWSNRPSAPAGD